LAGKAAPGFDGAGEWPFDIEGPRLMNELSASIGASRRTDQWPDGAAFSGDEYCPIAEAKILVLDWGFTRSDVCYDVVHVKGGTFFRLDDHINWFLASMKSLRMQILYDGEAMKEVLAECVRLNGRRDSYVVAVCNRGMPCYGPRGPVSGYQNRFIAYALPWIDVLSPEIPARGGHVTVAKTPRMPAKSVDLTIKNYHRGDMVQAMFEAEDAGADTAVLLDHDGYVTEGPGFNVFVVWDGAVMTPGRGALEGIIGKATLDLCQQLGITAKIGRLWTEDLHEADEVFLTTTAGGIMPVSRVDGRLLSNDNPGPVSRRLKGLYRQRHKKGWMATPVDYTDPVG
jgi:branched-chain amino acid aminotransferase